MISREIDIIKPNGERLQFKVEMEAPVPNGQDFSCKINFMGWINEPPHPIQGMDSYQSLKLAMELVHSILSEHKKRGYRFVWPDTDLDFDLNEFLAIGYDRRTEHLLKP